MAVSLFSHHAEFLNSGTLQRVVETLRTSGVFVVGDYWHSGWRSRPRTAVYKEYEFAAYKITPVKNKDNTYAIKENLAKSIDPLKYVTH